VFYAGQDTIKAKKSTTLHWN